jgi:hypothetical protein
LQAGAPKELDSETKEPLLHGPWLPGLFVYEISRVIAKRAIEAVWHSIPVRF